MNKLGLIEKFSGKRVDPVYFFSENMKGLFKKFDVRFSGFLVQEAPEPMETNVLLIRQETDTFDAYSIYLDKLFTGDLRKVPQKDYLPTLWYNFIMHARKWVVHAEKVPIKDLIPPSVLCDEIEDTKEIADAFFKKHMLETWTDLEVAQNFDAAALGLYVARLMVDQPKRFQEMSFDDLAELILKARNGNWHKLIDYP